MKDFSQYKFRCSSLGAIMTDARSKAEGALGETCKAELLKIYIKEVYGREKEITSKYVQKGLAVEDDSITLLSRVHQKFYVKNETRFENDYLTGEPDIVSPLVDTKSCWDIHTFYAAKTKPLSKDYYYQMLGYEDLLKVDIGTVAFCLTDTPLAYIENEKKQLYWKMDVTTMENPDYLAACAQLEKEMTFSDVPLEERVHKVKVAFSRESMDKVYERIDLCRDWLNRFVKQNQPKMVMV